MRPFIAGFLAHKSYGGPTATAILLNVAGQSNAIAAGTTGDAVPAGYSATPTNTFIWVPGTSSWAAYQAGVNSDPKGEIGNAWGMEVAFVQKLRDAGETRPIYIHKWASGGQSLNVGWKPGTGTTWTAWNTQRTAVLAALDAVHPNRLEAMLWNQGEACARPANSASHEANLDALISGWAATAAPGAKWITQRIRPYTGDLTNFPLNDCYVVRAAQEKARSNVLVIDQDFEPAGFATLHPDVSWVIEAGVRCYNAYSAGTQVSDTTPSNLGTISDVTGATTGATVTSNEITIAGIDRGAAVTITGGEYRVRNSDDSLWQDWTSSPGTIHPFHKLALRTTASGSPSTAVNVTVTVGGVSDVWSVTTASATLTISGTPPSPVNVGTPYTFTPTVSGGVPAYSFSLAAGTLPDGLTVNSSTGITGTPTTAGTASGLVLRVTDSASATADLGPFDIVVNAVSSLVAWDPTVNNLSGAPNIVYTNGNRTASTSANTSAVRTTRPPPASGKTSGNWYYRIEASGSTAGGSRGFGLVLQGTPPGTGTIGTNRWSWSGTSVSSNSAACTMPFNLTLNNGQLELAIRVAENLFWVRQAGVGANWNNDPSADPVTGVGGLSCSGRGTAAIFPFAVLPDTTVASSWTFIPGTPPSGFTEWS